MVIQMIAIMGFQAAAPFICFCFVSSLLWCRNSELNGDQLEETKRKYNESSVEL